MLIYCKKYKEVIRNESTIDKNEKKFHYCLITWIVEIDVKNAQIVS